MSEFTHFDESGRAVMVDVAGKDDTRRVAVASGRISMLPDTLARILDGQAAKGDVLGIARIAAIQATKRTAELIPLCHPVALTRVSVEFSHDAAESCDHLHGDRRDRRQDRGGNGGADRRQRRAC